MGKKNASSVLVISSEALASESAAKTENSKFAKSKLLLDLLFVILFSIIISVSFISAQTYQVEVTEEHPFLLSDGNYVPASQLEIGDELKTIDGKKARITSVKDVVLDEAVEVYNLDTEKYDDFVLPGGVVVHNSDVPVSKVNPKNLKLVSETLDVDTDQATRFLEGKIIYVGKENECYIIDTFYKLENNELVFYVLYIKSKIPRAMLTPLIKARNDAYNLASRLGFNKVKILGLAERNKDLFDILRNKGFQKGSATEDWFQDGSLESVEGYFKEFDVSCP